MYKGAAVRHMLALETGSWQPFNVARCQVRTYTSDQGIEQEVAGSPCLYVDNMTNASKLYEDFCSDNLRSHPPSSSTAMCYVLPYVLFFADCLHIIFNGLEECVVATREWKTVGPHLHTIAAFLSDRDLRYRMIEACLPPAAKRGFNQHFSWKSQYLQRFLASLVPLLPALQCHYDAAKVRGDDTWSKVSSVVIDEMHKATGCKQLSGVVLVLPVP